MSNENSKFIPEIQISHFIENNFSLVILSLEELYGRYYSIISNPHRITYYQLLLVCQGKGTVCIDSSNFNLESKSLIAVSNGQVLRLQIDENSKGYAVFFSEEYINKYPEDVQWLHSLKIFDPMSYPSLINLPEEEYRLMTGIIRQMEIEFNMVNEFAREECLLNLLKTIIIMSEREKRIESYNCRLEDYESSYLTEFKKKLEENYYTKKMVRDYAESLNITTKKLNQITNRLCKKSAKHIIEERVLMEIKRLLIYTDWPVKQIGHLLGFNDSTNFNRFFKKFTKVTPIDFRSTYR
ncbi:MAG: helix-turn-helix domain-containing protein [Bacteroidota bacterium]|nr:helix-turn-helix domain-containing protein [Bacteroidota bacterium]MDP4190604.1 helix-turn-helix domain-containing protein [Bacteroidota bacterium]MDP4195057.1 helix-turn-helix domain-containing protein [Bacteroidota bacterium]